MAPRILLINDFDHFQVPECHCGRFFQILCLFKTNSICFCLCICLWKLLFKNRLSCSSLDEAITANGFGHFQVSECHLGLIPAAFSRFPGFPASPPPDVSLMPLFLFGRRLMPMLDVFEPGQAAVWWSRGIWKLGGNIISSFRTNGNKNVLEHVWSGVNKWQQCGDVRVEVPGAVMINWPHGQSVDQNFVKIKCNKLTTKS